MEQLALDIGLTPQPSFARFDPCGNEAAVQCLQEGIAQLTAPASAGAPLPVYLWGAAGTGKSHLLQSVALALQEAGLAVGWLRPDTLQAAGAQPEFNPRWRAILLDDVGRFDPATQQCAFNWFINATHPGEGPPCWVLAAGDAPPVDLPLREDLRSRLGSGLGFALQPLNDTQRQQVLQRQAQERGVTLSDEVAQYLLGRFARDLSSLSALLAQLDAHALRTQRAITIPLLRQMLEQRSPAAPAAGNAQAPRHDQG